MELELLAFRKSIMFFQYKTIDVDKIIKIYSFILHGDDEKLFYLKSFKYDDTNSYVGVEIINDVLHDSYKYKWTINHKIRVIKNIIDKNKIELLENLFKEYQRIEKFKTILEK